MTKSFSRTFMISALLYFLLGLAMVIWPDASRLTICYTVGIVLALYGVIRILMQWNALGFLSLGNGFLAGLLCLLVGLLIIIQAQAVLAIFGTVLGLLLLADSIIKLQISYQLSSQNKPSARRNAICALITLVLSVILLFNPFTGLRAMTIYIGISLMLDAVIDFLIALDMRRHLRDHIILEDF